MPWPFPKCLCARSMWIKGPRSQGAGEAALEQSSWKSNYSSLLQQRNSPSWAPAPLQLQTKRREKETLRVPFHLLTGQRGNIPRLLFLLSGCRSPILLKSLWWSGGSPPPLSTAWGAFLWEELREGRSRKCHWFQREATSPGNGWDSWDDRYQAT